jgi:predicted transcriptional regulator
MRNKIAIIADGNVLKEFDAGSHYIRSREQNKAYRKIKDKEMNYDRRKFIWCDNNNVLEVGKQMNLVEAGAMFSIMVHLDFNSDGIIVKNGKSVTMKDLESILGKSKRQVMTLLTNLERLSLVFRVKHGRETKIQVNEAFHYIGKSLNKDFKTKVYTVKARTLVEQLNLQELGLLYKIIPHFHYEHMILCKNPDERDTNKLEYMKAEELADSVGVDKRTFFRLLPKLRQKGVIMSMKTGQKTTFAVNPNLFFRMSTHTEVSKTLKMTFDMLTNKRGS